MDGNLSDEEWNLVLLFHQSDLGKQYLRMK